MYGEQQARLRQFAQQQLDLGVFVQRRVVGLHAGLGEQLGQHALVDVGRLAHVQRGQVEAEDVGRALQRGRRGCTSTRRGWR
jgi:hypothetical protein